MESHGGPVGTPLEVQCLVKSSRRARKGPSPMSLSVKPLRAVWRSPWTPFGTLTVTFALRESKSAVADFLEWLLKYILGRSRNALRVSRAMQRSSRRNG